MSESLSASEASSTETEDAFSSIKAGDTSSNSAMSQMAKHSVSLNNSSLLSSLGNARSFSSKNFSCGGHARALVPESAGARCLFAPTTQVSRSNRSCCTNFFSSTNLRFGMGNFCNRENNTSRMSFMSLILRRFLPALDSGLVDGKEQDRPEGRAAYVEIREESSPMPSCWKAVAAVAGHVAQLEPTAARCTLTCPLRSCCFALQAACL
mmetsp:Transcript_92838/g.170323  ORF Transcript_92838/g.170323 Transcript_92838/m.170323 type:complete len:209 (-) Transcript_92838:23-649(-)